MAPLTLVISLGENSTWVHPSSGFYAMPVADTSVNSSVAQEIVSFVVDAIGGNLAAATDAGHAHSYEFHLNNCIGGRFFYCQHPS